MKVYLVYWCNNEAYEDYYVTVDAVCATRELAERFILSKGYRPHVCVDEWEKRNWANRYDSKPDEFGGYSSMWIREMEVIEQ